MAATPAGRTPAPASTATVAPFRAWRGLRSSVAGNRRESPWKIPHPIADRVPEGDRLDECKWRRERDSNPRYGDKPYTHFPGVLLQPLGHLSVSSTRRTSVPGAFCPGATGVRRRPATLLHALATPQTKRPRRERRGLGADIRFAAAVLATVAVGVARNSTFRRVPRVASRLLGIVPRHGGCTLRRVPIAAEVAFHFIPRATCMVSA